MDVERVEAAILGQNGLSHLGRRSVCHAIGSADDEAVEGVARIERRALEAVHMRTAERRGRGLHAGHRTPRLGHRHVDIVLRAGLHRHVRRRRRPRGRKARLAEVEIDALGPLELGSTALEEVVGVMRLDPALEELHGHGSAHDAAIERLEFHRIEPAGIDVFTQARPQHRADFVASLVARLGIRVRFAGASTRSKIARFPSAQHVACAKPPHCDY